MEKKKQSRKRRNGFKKASLMKERIKKKEKETKQKHTHTHLILFK